jgi:hypothetical protein
MISLRMVKQPIRLHQARQPQVAGCQVVKLAGSKFDDLFLNLQVGIVRRIQRSSKIE